MAEKTSNESFWKTIPGIITAVATFITAIGGLIVVLFQVGLIGSGNSAPAKAAASITEKKDASQNGVSGLSTVADNVTYQVVTSPTISSYSGTENRVSFRVRVTTKEKGINFEDALFRLLAEGDMIAPIESRNNKYIPEYSSDQGTVEFIVSKTTTAVKLQVGFQSTGRTGIIPINLATVK